MKEMKRQIISTCLIVSIIGTIISGCYNVISLHKQFFTLGVLADGVMVALVYLIYLWINMRKNKTLVYVIICLFFILVLIVSLFDRNAAKEIYTFSWKEAAMVALYSISYGIAKTQVDLSKEE